MVIDLATFYDLPKQFDRIFDEFLRPSVISQKRIAYPAINIYEDEDNLYVYSELPGLDINDVELTLTDGSLILKGERKSEQGNYYRQERPTGIFQRIINLNIPIDADKIKAKMKNGLLEVILPKLDINKPKKIQIES
ncbi:MAG: Hsp20/alpha crystallin family protein [Desulfonauticus sp.]|nr:Hsp20/alpha crystallin family protein [Desulfonauticus sp.]